MELPPLFLIFLSFVGLYLLLCVSTICEYVIKLCFDVPEMCALMLIVMAQLQ